MIYLLIVIELNYTKEKLDKCRLTMWSYMWSEDSIGPSLWTNLNTALLPPIRTIRSSSHTLGSFTTIETPSSGKAEVRP